MNHFSLHWLQIPADGILISGQSLALDESSMTGESKIVSVSSDLLGYTAAISLLTGINFVIQVHKDSKSPFLMSGCKVADGYGMMLVGSFSAWCLCVWRTYFGRFLLNFNFRISDIQMALEIPDLL